MLAGLTAQGGRATIVAIMPHNIHIQFFTKPGCLLCDEARDLLESLCDEFPLTIEETNILTDLTLYERYKHMIPVLVFDGGFTLWGRIREAEVRKGLEGR